MAESLLLQFLRQLSELELRRSRDKHPPFVAKWRHEGALLIATAMALRSVVAAVVAHHPGPRAGASQASRRQARDP